MNKAILIGNLGKDAEMRFTQGGTAVATFNIATTEKFTDRDGNKKEDTQWHTIVVWGKTAEAIHQYLTKGKQVAVEGKIQTRKWTDKEGKDRWSTEIRADRVQLLGGGRGESGGGGGRAHSGGSGDEHDQSAGPVNDDDIPF